MEDEIDDDTNIWNGIIGGKDCIKDCIEDIKSKNSITKNKKYYSKGKKPRT